MKAQHPQRKYSAIIGAMASLTLIVSACGSDRGAADDSTTPSGTGAVDSDSNAPADSGDQNIITIAEINSPETLDPHKSSETANRYIWELGYECLMKVDEHGDPQPWLASAVDTSDDQLTHTFTLRDGVTFQNGKPLTATDVVYTYNRQMSDGIPYVQDRFPTYESVEAIDEKTVAFHLSATDPAFLLNMGDPTVIACAILSKDGSENGNLATEMVGTGPYKLTDYSPDNQADLETYADYWGDKPANDGVRIIYMPSISSQREALASGKIDLMFASSELEVKPLEDNSQLKIDPVKTDDIVLVQVNNTTEPFDNIKVRQAVALTMDREQIADVAYQGAAEPTGPIPPSFDWAPSPESLANYGPDAQKAKDLLAEAGYPDGFKTTLTYWADYGESTKRFTEVFAQQLKGEGIDAELIPVTKSQFFDSVSGSKHKYDLAWNAYGHFSDPYQYMRARSGRQDPSPDSEVTDALNAVTSAADLETYKKALVELVKADAQYVYPVIPVVALNAFVAYTNKIKDVELTASLNRHFLVRVSK